MTFLSIVQIHISTQKGGKIAFYAHEERKSERPWKDETLPSYLTKLFDLDLSTESITVKLFRQVNSSNVKLWT